jgi:hypothetical protein
MCYFILAILGLVEEGFFLSLFFFFFFFFFVVLEFDLRASHLLGRHSTI